MKIISKFQHSGKFPSREYIKRKQQFLNQNGIKVKIDGSWGSWQQEQYNKIMSKQLKELEPHYYIDIEVKERKYTNNIVDKWGHNNTFKTKEEANKKVEKIYEVLEELQYNIL